MKPDRAHRETDKLIEEVEKRTRELYAQASKEVQEKLDDYLRRLEVKDRIWQQNVEDGKATLEEWQQWRRGQIMAGYRWEALQNQLAEDLHNTNVIARDIVNSARCEAYALNMNYATWRVERAARVNTSFTLYSRESVERILKDQPELLPPPGKQMKKRLAAGLDVAWQKGQIQSVVAQAIVQGESIPNMAKRIARTMGESNHKSTIRYARTAMTGAQNAGRMDAYHRAEGLGIEMQRQWVATLDERTRYEHRQLDGQTAALDEPFRVDGYEIMFPGDPAADGEMIWNCRCTLIPSIKGVSNNLERRSLADIGDYNAWKENHIAESHPITKQEDIGEGMKWRTINEDYRR